HDVTAVCSTRVQRLPRLPRAAIATGGPPATVAIVVEPANGCAASGASVSGVSSVSVLPSPTRRRPAWTATDSGPAGSVLFASTASDVRPSTITRPRGSARDTDDPETESDTRCAGGGITSPTNLRVPASLPR